MLGVVSASSECYVKGTNDWFASDTLSLDPSNLGFHNYGNNDAFLDSAIDPVLALLGDSVLTADIDLHPQMSLTYGRDAEGNISSINASGTVMGDAFPNAEVFLRDSAGTGVMLGTFSHDPGASPFNSLPGNNTRPMISISDISINVQNGVFASVTHQGTTYSIDDWNRRFGVAQSQ
jgi:hypothetical protein